MSALALKAVSVVGQGRRVLDALDLDLAEGARIAVVGVNGAGKSLLARIAAGLERPTSGRVEAFGCDWSDGAEVAELRRRVGVGLPQGALLADLTAAENLRFALPPVRRSGERRARVRVDRALADVGAEYYGDRPIGALSVGERRRIDLARILISDPELLILDDVLAGIDERGADDLAARIDRSVGRRRRALLWIGGSRARAEQMAGVVLTLENGRLLPPQQAERA